LAEILQNISVSNAKIHTLQEIKTDFEKQQEDFELFWYSKPVNSLRVGLLVL
jgi:hypothetical protein